MSLRNASALFHRSTHAVAGEFVRLTAILGGLYLWHRLGRAVTSTVAPLGSSTPFGGSLLFSFLLGGVTVGGVLLFTVAYADSRNISLGLGLPSRRDRWLVGVAGLIPLAGVALTKLVGTLTGVQYNALLQYSVAADASLLPVLQLTGISLVLGVPLYVAVCQILIQGGLGRIVDADRAIVLTTLAAGFVLLSNTGGLTTVPDRGKILGLLVFTLLLGVGPYFVDHFGSDRRPAVAYGPALLFVAFVVVSGLAAVDSLSGSLFTATHLAVLGVAAYSSDRTGSVLPPAVAYTTLELANTGIIYFFEAGMQSW
ncbi:hypothetical protein [Halohasta litorea]|uniref:Uncharacterized protein n=1 Tax=Halohasta litorea TaxID=869891 RepID=A0ABD6D8T7_9EURY|nr:hypothetical protein [Halohasta litorea]